MEGEQGEQKKKIMLYNMYKSKCHVIVNYMLCYEYFISC